MPTRASRSLMPRSGSWPARGRSPCSTNPRPTPTGGPASIPIRRSADTTSWPIPRKDSHTSWPAGVSAGPKARSSRPSTSALQRGVLVHGRVTEEGSGKPVPGALVDFTMRRGPVRPGFDHVRPYRFRRLIPARGPARAGTPLRAGSGRHYVFQAIGSRMVLRRPAGRRQDVLARLCCARPETGHGQPGGEPGPPPRRDRGGPGRRAGWPARPGCLDLQPAHPRPESRGGEGLDRHYIMAR